MWKSSQILALTCVVWTSSPSLGTSSTSEVTDSNNDRSQVSTSTTVDEKGYIIYCPCMGRFGNQAAHLLGSLAFAHITDRTLVLPAWPTHEGFIEFDEWFNIQVLQTYHRVVTAATFMELIAPKVWPDGQKIGFCYRPSHGHYANMEKCELKSGSPFFAFWNNLDVEFDSTMFYNLAYSETDEPLWAELYPPNKYPVLAFKGAPASFPVQAENVYLHKYLWWTDSMVEAASHLIYSLIGDAKYIAVHLRNGRDWENACQHAVNKTSFMSSPQCTGYTQEILISENMCLPENSHVIKRIGEAVKHTNVTNIYVLTDQYPLLTEIEQGLSYLGVSAVHADPDIPQQDLIIAAQSELFIGNCISSFTAFVKRERDHIVGKPTWFFGIEP